LLFLLLLLCDAVCVLFACHVSVPAEARFRKTPSPNKTKTRC
jgi:hypothetical protein